MTMIPASYERRPPHGGPPESAATPPPADRRVPPTVPPAEARGELPGWVRASLFAAALLAVTWLAMFVQSLAR